MTIKRKNVQPSKQRNDRGPVATTGRRPDLLDYVEAAAYLGVRTSTLQSWVASGFVGLPYLRLGRRVRFMRSRLDAWLLSREVGGLAPAPEAEQAEAR